MSLVDKKYLDNALLFEKGYIVRFNREAFMEFFRNFGIDIYNDNKYYLYIVFDKKTNCFLPFRSMPKFSYCELFLL